MLESGEWGLRKKKCRCENSIPGSACIKGGPGERELKRVLSRYGERGGERRKKIFCARRGLSGSLIKWKGASEPRLDYSLAGKGKPSREDVRASRAAKIGVSYWIVGKSLKLPTGGDKPLSDCSMWGGKKGKTPSKIAARGTRKSTGSEGRVFLRKERSQRKKKAEKSTKKRLERSHFRSSPVAKKGKENLYAKESGRGEVQGKKELGTTAGGGKEKGGGGGAKKNLESTVSRTQ